MPDIVADLVRARRLITLAALLGLFLGLAPPTMA